jgi:hypothetical protein
LSVKKMLSTALTRLWPDQWTKFFEELFELFVEKLRTLAAEDGPFIAEENAEEAWKL